MSATAVPIVVTQDLERLVTKFHNDAEKSSNALLLDEGQVYELHAEIARIYQLGYEHGTSAQMERDRYAANRIRDRKPITLTTKEATP